MRFKHKERWKSPLASFAGNHSLDRTRAGSLRVSFMLLDFSNIEHSYSPTRDIGSHLIQQRAERKGAKLMEITTAPRYHSLTGLSGCIR
jgi:hypothetical protein